MSTPASMFHFKILLGSIGFLPSAGARTSESGKGSKNNGTSAAAAASQRIKKKNLCQEAGDEEAGDEDAERRGATRLAAAPATARLERRDECEKQNKTKPKTEREGK